jgi:hypothetical protein
MWLKAARPVHRIYINIGQLRRALPVNRLIDVSLAMDGPIWIASVLLDREIELSCTAGATLRETDGNRLASRITIRRATQAF